MDTESLEKYLSKLRNHIYIDQAFKEQLRKKYIKKRRQKIFRRTIFSGLAAAILFLVVFANFNQKIYVNASSLAVNNAISFFDVGSGEITSFTHHNGDLYVSIKNKGIYQYNDQGLTLIAEVFPEHLKFSSNVNYLLYSKDGTVSLFDLNTRKSEELLTKDSKYRYTFPAWKNDHSIFVTKQSQTESVIIEYDLNTNKQKELAVGSQPTWIESENQLVFEQNGNIVVKNLKNGQKQIIDKGKDPFISNDGLYISYVKTENDIDNVWIADIDGKTKKKVTANPPNRLAPDQGLYQYANPVWNIEAHEIYVLKKQDELPAKIMKIKLGSEEISATETVEQYLQAIINRDDDYAKSLMEQPPEFLTYSNPQQIGYQIIGSEQKGDTFHVTAEGYWVYTANPSYQLSTYEFILTKKGNRFLIESINRLTNKHIASKDNHEIQVVQELEEMTLFSFNDLPKEYLTHENIRFSSLVENPLDKTIIFALQEFETEGKNAEVSIISYNQETKAFKLISRIESTGKGDVVLEHLSIDPTGQYIAADVFMGDVSSLILFDLNKGTETRRFQSAHSHLWQKEELLLTIHEEEQTLLYQYNPKSDTIKTF